MGGKAISTMKVLSLVVSSLGLATALFGADSGGTGYYSSERDFLGS